MAKSTGQIGVDWKSMGDDLTAEDREKIERWYKEYHGEGNLDLAPFIPFWLNNRPGVLFRYRRWVESMPMLDGRLSSAAMQLVLLHNYTAIGYDRGVLYEDRRPQDRRHEAAGARHHGLRLSALRATPHVAELRHRPRLHGRLGWPRRRGRSEIWPDGWSVDPTALRSGLDFSTTGLTDDELELLDAWYQQHFGEVPAYVSFLARYHPEGLKAYRSRYGYPTTHTLPTQLFPLFTFFSSAYQGNATGMRRGIHQARHLGVDKAHLTTLACIAMVYLGDPRIDSVVEVVEPLFDSVDRLTHDGCS